MGGAGDGSSVRASVDASGATRDAAAAPAGGKGGGAGMPVGMQGRWDKDEDEEGLAGESYYDELRDEPQRLSSEVRRVSASAGGGHQGMQGHGGHLGQAGAHAYQAPAAASYSGSGTPGNVTAAAPASGGGAGGDARGAGGSMDSCRGGGGSGSRSARSSFVLENLGGRDSVDNEVVQPGEVDMYGRPSFAAFEPPRESLMSRVAPGASGSGSASGAGAAAPSAAAAAAAASRGSVFESALPIDLAWRYRQLGALLPQAPLPLASLQRVWQYVDLIDAQEAAQIFEMQVCVWGG